jgi:hypothetical protein
VDGFFVFAAPLVFFLHGEAGGGREGERGDFLVDAVDIVLHQSLAVKARSSVVAVGSEIERRWWGEIGGWWMACGAVVGEEFGVGEGWNSFIVRGCGIEFGWCGLDRCGVPAALPAPGALLAGFEVLDLTVGDPFWAALEVGAEEVADTVCVFEATDVNRQCRKDLKDTV